VPLRPERAQRMARIGGVATRMPLTHPVIVTRPKTDDMSVRPRGRSSGFLTSAAKQLDVELRRARPQRESTRTRLPGSDPGHHLKRLLSMNSL
jgi:hypothetical protein